MTSNDEKKNANAEDITESAQDEFKHKTDEEMLKTFESDAVAADEVVVSTKFHISDLLKTEDWLSIWIGFILIGLAVISVTTGIIPNEGVFAFKAAKFGSWATPEMPTPFGYMDGAFFVKVIYTFLILAFFFSIGTKMMGRSIAEYIPAFAVLFLFACFTYVLDGHVGLKSYFGYAVWALLIGLIISNTVGTPKFMMPALQTEYYIKTGLVLMGAEVLFSNIAKFGGYGLAIAWLVTPTVIIFMWLFGRRWLKMDNPRMIIVIACATSVCGVSAAIAAAAASRAKRAELTFAIGLSMIFTVIMMIGMPLFIKAVGMDTMIGAAWIGGTVDSTGAVVLAGEVLGPVGAQVAAMVKMIQNILIGFIAFAIAIFFTTQIDRDTDAAVGPGEIWHRFPKFILGFIVASIFSSFVLQPTIGVESTASVISITKSFQGWLFCLAFMSIGLESNFRELAAQMAGGKPMVLYVVGQSFNLVLTLLVAWIALSGNFFPIPDMTIFTAN